MKYPYNKDLSLVRVNTIRPNAIRPIELLHGRIIYQWAVNILAPA